MVENLLEGVKPTRMELLEIRKRKELAMKGHEILAKKRDALISEFLSVLERRGNMKRQLERTIAGAREKLLKAEISMGPELAATEEAFSHSREVIADTVKIMGIPVPSLRTVAAEDERKVPYGILTTSRYLDMAYMEFKGVMNALIKLAEIDGSIERMAKEIERTKRRVNALEHIFIPRLAATERYINMQLEEREREEFFRRKRIKAILEARDDEGQIQG